MLDAGQVAMLRHLHDRLDAAVAAAYGWPADLPAEVRRRAEQAALDVDEAAALPAWPKGGPAQFVALRAALARGGPTLPADLARRFRGAPRGAKLAEMLATLVALGQAREAGAGRYAG